VVNKDAAFNAPRPLSRSGTSTGTPARLAAHPRGNNELRRLARLGEIVEASRNVHPQYPQSEVPRPIRRWSTPAKAQSKRRGPCDSAIYLTFVFPAAGGIEG